MNEKVLETLKRLGFVTIPVEKFHLFEYEGRGFFYYVDDEDDSFLSIVLPNLMDANSDDEEEHEDNFMDLLRMQVEVNNKVKYVKAFVKQDSLWLSYEHEVYAEEDLEELIPKMILHLLGTSEFVRSRLLISQMLDNIDAGDVSVCGTEDLSEITDEDNPLFEDVLETEYVEP